MDTQPNDNIKQDQAQAVSAQPRTKLSVSAFIVTVLAWVTLPLHYLVSSVLCIIGLALSIIGMRKSQGGYRNLAQVSLVASAVLLLIYAIIWGALFYIAVEY